MTKWSFFTKKEDENDAIFSEIISIFKSLTFFVNLTKSHYE